MITGTLEHLVITNFSKTERCKIIIFYNDGLGQDQQFELTDFNDYLTFKDYLIDDWEYVKDESCDVIKVWLCG